MTKPGTASSIAAFGRGIENECVERAEGSAKMTQIVGRDFPGM
jgi:hypothetical protein